MPDLNNLSNAEIESYFGSQPDIQAARAANPNFNLAQWYNDYGRSEVQDGRRRVAGLNDSTTTQQQAVQSVQNGSLTDQTASHINSNATGTTAGQVNANSFGLSNDNIERLLGSQPDIQAARAANPNFNLAQWFNDYGRQELIDGRRYVAGLNNAEYNRYRASQPLDATATGANPTGTHADAPTNSAAASSVGSVNNDHMVTNAGYTATTLGVNALSTLSGYSGTDVISFGSHLNTLTGQMSTDVMHLGGTSTGQNLGGYHTYTAALAGNDVNTLSNNTQVDPRSTVQGQYNSLMDQNNWTNGTPDWARGAARTAEQTMAARGVGSSSMAGEAITSALMQAALPIAQQDATTYAQMDQARFSARVNALFNDQAATNASRQFNATSAAQTDQFFAGLSSQVQQFNASQAQAMAQFQATGELSANQFNATQDINRQMFNTGVANQREMFNAQAQNAAAAGSAQLNTSATIAGAQLATQVSEFNAQQTQALNTFNAQLQNQREQFNSQMAAIIDQSNVQWRRAVNTANTAADNTVNMQNAQMAYGLTTQTMSAFWQQLRDEADQLFRSTENTSNRNYYIAAAALNRDFQSNQATQAERDSMYRALGMASLGIVSSLLGSGSGS